jgi:hypothetical protein
VPTDLLNQERWAAMVSMGAPVLLKRAGAAYGGQLMLMKGPEVAARYRHPSDRGFYDLDLLADDAAAAQAALLAAGFVQFGDPTGYRNPQHLCPLIWPGIPLIIELHRRPGYPPWLPPLNVLNLFNDAVPSVTAASDGLLAPSPEAHALLLAAHSWTHQPLGRLGDLLDIAVISRGSGRGRVDELARAWGWEPMWRVVHAVAEAVLCDDNARPMSLSTWGRHLRSARQRTVLEGHLARIAAPASALPVRLTPRAVAQVMRSTASRRDDEPWTDKFRRSRLAVAHAFMEVSAHDRHLSPKHASKR